MLISHNELHKMSYLMEPTLSVPFKDLKEVFSFVFKTFSNIVCQKNLEMVSVIKQLVN